MANPLTAIAHKIQKKIHKAGHTKITDIRNGNLCLDRTAFDKFIAKSKIGDKAFSIISICGATRQGKSFMMNFILRYFELKQWENHNKVTTSDSKIRMTAFKVAAGDEHVTGGILLYNHTFEVMWNNKPMVVILMDTQGIFDPALTKRDEAFLLTITTLMSSVQIFNVLQRVDTTKFDALQNAITYGELSANEGRYLKLQNLTLLVRDRKMSKEKCQQYLNKLFTGESLAQENRAVAAKIRETFSNVDLFCLPRPGQKAEEPDSEDDQEEIEEDDIAGNFRESVHAFLSATISPFDRLEPKFTNDRDPIKIRDLYKLMIVCDGKFKYSNEDGRIDGKDIIEGEDRVAYESKHEQLYKEFVDKIQHMDYESKAAIEGHCKDLSKEVLHQFCEEVSQWNVSDAGGQYETKYKEKLADQMEAAGARRVLQWMNEQEMKKLELKKKSEHLFEAYVANMEDCDTVSKLKSKHDSVLSIILNTETTYDHDELFRLIDGEYEKMEQNIMEKEHEKMKPDLREEVVHWIVRKQKMSLRDVWKDLMNDKTNTKYKILTAKLRNWMFPWRETKFLALEEEDMEAIYVLAESKVLGSYWDCNLQNIEKSNIEKLNEKLWNEMKSIMNSPPPKNRLPLHLSGAPNVFLTISVPRARRLVRKAVAHCAPGGGKSQLNQEEYTAMINSAVWEFTKIYAEDESVYRSGEITPLQGKIESVNITFLNEICPALMEGYRELEVILKESKAEMTAMRKNIREDTMKKLTLFMERVIITIREEFQNVMVDRHYNPDKLEAKYMQRLNRGFNSMYDDAIGFGSGAKIKELIYERAMVNQSLESILEENARNENAILNNLDDIDFGDSIFTKISEFFTSFFRRND